MNRDVCAHGTPMLIQCDRCLVEARKTSGSAFERWYEKHFPSLDADCYESEMQVAVSAWNASRIDILSDLYHELAEIRWEGVDASWNAAIEAVRDRLFYLGTTHSGIESPRPILKTPNGEVRGASRPAGEASSAEGATSTVVLGNGGNDD